MIVEDGPKRASRDVPKMGRIKFAAIEGMKAKKNPKKQYLIWMRSNPNEVLKDLIRNNIPTDIKEMKYIAKIIWPTP